MADKSFIENNFLTIDIENYNGGITYNSSNIGKTAAGCDTDNAIYDKINKVYIYDLNESKKADGKIPYYVNTMTDIFDKKNIHKVGSIDTEAYRNGIMIGDSGTEIEPTIGGNVNKDIPYDGNSSFKYNAGNWEQTSGKYDDTDLMKETEGTPREGSIVAVKDTDGNITSWARLVMKEGKLEKEMINITGDEYNSSNTLKKAMNGYMVSVKPMAARN